MSKFISHKDGEIINGDGTVSEATIFVTADGQEESIIKGSPIEKLLLEEVDGVEVAAVVEPTTVVDSTIVSENTPETTVSTENPVSPVETPTEPNMNSVDPIVAPVQETPSV